MPQMRRTTTVVSRRREHPHQPEDDINDFFARNGLPADSIHHCIEHAKSRLPPGIVIEPLRTQGYCSLTLLAATEPVASIVQFRPETHRLDAALADDVRSIFGPVAPLTRSLGYLFVPGSYVKQNDDGDHHQHRRRLRDRIFHRHRHDHHDHEHGDNSDEHDTHNMHPRSLGDSNTQVILHVYSMSFLPGTPLTTHRIARLPPNVAGAHRAALVRSLANHFAVAWRNGRYPDAPRRPQTLVASSIRGRLESMSHTLPPRFRTSVSQVLARLPQIEALPWVMTHGDLVPVNVLVDPQRGEISGLIDWAEAEYLPFGTGMYGLEELLSHPASLPEEETEGRKHWGYFPDVAALRELFWLELMGMVPELREGGMVETVRLAGQMGVLLWCGIAFDDGRLDRVVQDGHDAIEVAKLDLFLLSPDGCRDDSAMRAQAEVKSTRRKDPQSFLFSKTDDEEDVQELREQNPIRYKL